MKEGKGGEGGKVSCLSTFAEGEGKGKGSPFSIGGG